MTVQLVVMLPGWCQRLILPFTIILTGGRRSIFVVAIFLHFGAINAELQQRITAESI